MNQTYAAAKQLSSNHQTQSHSLDIIEPELIETLSRVTEQLNLLAEQSLNETTSADSLAEKLSLQLKEVAGVFSMLDLPVAANLSLQLVEAVNRLCVSQSPSPSSSHSQSDEIANTREYEALFQCVYLLPRFFEYVQTTGVASPLLLAPCFYALASAGLSKFVMENELVEFDYQAKSLSESLDNKAGSFDESLDCEEVELSLVPLPSVEEQLDVEIVDQTSEQNRSPEDQQQTFRRLRQMYQTALIGLLRDNDISGKLKLIDHVSERCLELCSGSVTESVWRLLRKVVVAFNEHDLELTAQRRHFFAKFDRSLKQLEKDPLHGMHCLSDEAVLAELSLLLLLADTQHVNDKDINRLGKFTPLPWSDKALLAHREAMERSTYKALHSVLDVINDELLGAKRVLDMMSESGLCEADDVDTLVENCGRISAVLKVSGFATATSPIDNAVAQMNHWRSDAPDQEALLDIANMILFIENALLTGSLLTGAHDIDEHDQSVVAKGLLQQAQIHLYEESKSNVGLAKRAVVAYLDSNYDREHIANIGVCLASIGGAFNMMDIDSAAALMNRCAELLDSAYQGQSNDEIGEDWLERLADALVSVEYLLDELAAGRTADNMALKLITDSLAALE